MASVNDIFKDDSSLFAFYAEHFTVPNSHLRIFTIYNAQCSLLHIVHGSLFMIVSSRFSLPCLFSKLPIRTGQLSYTLDFMIPNVQIENNSTNC